MPPALPLVVASDPVPEILTPLQKAAKRALDVTVSVIALLVLAPVLLLAVLGARRSTGESGVFRQVRIGRGGEEIVVHKLRTMRTVTDVQTTVTTAHDVRITSLGRFLRRTKLDEVPQFYDVLRGAMSLVGPRPDVPGWADELTGADRALLSVRPGITGPATIAYSDEEFIHAAAEDPEAYNRDVIWPDKVRLNLEYLENWSLRADLVCLVRTVVR